MAAVSETIVREYFELHGFFVRQRRKFVAPEIYRFAEPGVFRQAARSFGEEGRLTKILAVPALPQGAAARAQSIDLLRVKGIDAVIPFRTMLADLIAKVEVNRNYQKSDLLQIIRILKRYDFFKEPQLELFKPKRAGQKRPAPE